MNLSSLKKGIAGVAVAGTLATGGVAIDNQTVTDAEIKASIEEAVVEGKIPQIDLSKVSLERLSEGYIAVATEAGVDLTPTEEEQNLYQLIREKKKEQGEKVLPETKETLLVK